MVKMKFILLSIWDGDLDHMAVKNHKGLLGIFGKNNAKLCEKMSVWLYQLG